MGSASPMDASSLMIERESLDDKVYERLSTLIADGEFLPGQRLDLDELSQAMGISRTPLVNALKRLNQEGLLDWVYRRGIYLKALNLKELVDLYEFREQIEPMAARLATGRMSRAEIADLRQSWLEMAALEENHETEKLFVSHDRLFHWRLVELADNPYLSASLARVNMMACLYLHGSPREWEETIADHVAILDAMDTVDPQAAAHAMYHHINQSTLALRRVLSEQK